MNQPLRILILEDRPEDVELIQRELRRMEIGPLTKCVVTLKEFLLALEEFQPDLVISDHNLLGFTGMEALKLGRLRYSELPFILVTGALGEELAVETIKQGATDYILKHRLGQLVPAILRAVREAEQRAQRRQAEELLKRQHKQLTAQNNALQESEQRFRQLAENVHEGFVTRRAVQRQIIQ